MSAFNPIPGFQERFDHTDQSPLDFDLLQRISMEQLLLNTRVHQDAWMFGKEEQWNLDLGQAELILSFPGRMVVAPAQVIGTFDVQTSVWTWAWANSSIPENLTVHALQLRDYGEQNGVPRLTTPEWGGQETDCWYMAALACRLCGFQGAYRGPSENVYSFITFGEAKLNPPLEDHQELLKNFVLEAGGEFRACLESSEDQRRACCRYFRRGLMVGLTQSELIDSLALSSPSVLESAGYPAEVAERVMEMIGGISDEEIQNS